MEAKKQKRWNMVPLDSILFIVMNHLPIPDINFWRNTIFLALVNFGHFKNNTLLNKI
jgi:hypothetical protein